MATTGFWPVKDRLKEAIDIPTEKEILATMEKIRNNPQDFKFVA